jgi:hypothetical protein
MEQSAFYARLRELVVLGDPKAFEAMAFEIGRDVLEKGIVPTDTFVALLAIFADEKFQQSEGSWKLIRVFEENWEQLSEEQGNTCIAN